MQNWYQGNTSGCLEEFTSKNKRKKMIKILSFREAQFSPKVPVPNSSLPLHTPHLSNIQPLTSLPMPTQQSWLQLCALHYSLILSMSISSFALSSMHSVMCGLLTIYPNFDYYPDSRYYRLFCIRTVYSVAENSAVLVLNPYD